jgi:hypothetical protein
VGALRQAIPLPEEPRDEFIAFSFLEALLFMFQQCAVKNRALTKQLTGFFEPSGQPDDYLSAEETATRDDLLLRLRHARTRAMATLKSDKALRTSLVAKLKTLPRPTKATQAKTEAEAKTEAPVEAAAADAAATAAAALVDEKLAERKGVMGQINQVKDMAKVYPSVFLLAGNLLNSPPVFAFGAKASCSWRTANASGNGRKKGQGGQQDKKKGQQQQKKGGQQQKKRKQPPSNNNNNGKKKSSAKKQKKRSSK